MANAKENGIFLTDIKIKQNSPAFRIMLNSPMLAALLRVKGLELARLYQAKVGYKTGKLQASVDVSIRSGGALMPGLKNKRVKDRIIGVVSIGGAEVVSEWKGKPFYYGVYHEQGTLNSKRAKRRTRRGPKPGYYELREAAHLWRGGP